MPEFAIADVTTGRLNALVKNIMDQMSIANPAEAVRRINAGEWVVSPVPRAWREEDRVISFSVTSDGTTGEEWIIRLERAGKRLTDYAKQILRSPAFTPTSGVTYEVRVLKGVLFTENERTTENIRAKAYAGTFTQGTGLCDPNAEVACLIREKFSDKDLEEMGLWRLVTMHEPIKDFVGHPDLLTTSHGDGGPWLHAFWVKPGSRWARGLGFGFVVPQAIQ